MWFICEWNFVKILNPWRGWSSSEVNLWHFSFRSHLLASFNGGNAGLGRRELVLQRKHQKLKSEVSFLWIVVWAPTAPVTCGDRLLDEGSLFPGSQSAVSTSTLNMLNLSFAGCGFLGLYHLGVVSCLKTFAPHVFTAKVSQPQPRQVWVSLCRCQGLRQGASLLSPCWWRTLISVRRRRSEPSLKLIVECFRTGGQRLAEPLYRGQGGSPGTIFSFIWYQQTFIWLFVQESSR